MLKIFSLLICFSLFCQTECLGSHNSVFSKNNLFCDDDFTTSGKNIVDHVADISVSNPKAAMWFLLTGGKYGFADRQATPEERAKLETAIENTANYINGLFKKIVDCYYDGKGPYPKDAERELHCTTISLISYKKDLFMSNELLNKITDNYSYSGSYIDSINRKWDNLFFFDNA